MAILGNISQILGEVVDIVPTVVSVVIALVPLYLVYVVIDWLRDLFANTMKHTKK